MIPRLKPSIGKNELIAALSPSSRNHVERFELEFSRLMKQKYAVAFPYGRTGLLILLKAMGIKDKEIICPAYTCVVVPHAVIYSGNRPVFVDCNSKDFNMNLELAGKAITKNTGAIIATSLFGYPVNLDQLDNLRRRYPHIPIIQDCAHSFAAEWHGSPVQKEGIAALFGLNISKIITSIYGGMVTTDDEQLFLKLKQLRNNMLEPANWGKKFKRLTYLLFLYPAFSRLIYITVNHLERMGLLNAFVKYYDDNKIDMPIDYLEQMTDVEARVGYRNTKRYQQIIENRRAAARYYFSHLIDKKSVRLPPKVQGATYSHFVVLVNDSHDRSRWLQEGLRRGIQLGQLIEYSIPEMSAYGGHASKKFPIAAKYSQTSLNLPVWGGENLAEKVCEKIRGI